MPWTLQQEEAFIQKLNQDSASYNLSAKDINKFKNACTNIKAAFLDNGLALDKAISLTEGQAMVYNYICSLGNDQTTAYTEAQKIVRLAHAEAFVTGNFESVDNVLSLTEGQAMVYNHICYKLNSNHEYAYVESQKIFTNSQIQAFLTDKFSSVDEAIEFCRDETKVIDLSNLDPASPSYQNTIDHFKKLESQKQHNGEVSKARAQAVKFLAPDQAKPFLWISQVDGLKFIIEEKTKIEKPLFKNQLCAEKIGIQKLSPEELKEREKEILEALNAYSVSLSEQEVNVALSFEDADDLNFLKNHLVPRYNHPAYGTENWNTMLERASEYSYTEQLNLLSFLDEQSRKNGTFDSDKENNLVIMGSMTPENSDISDVIAQAIGNYEAEQMAQLSKNINKPAFAYAGKTLAETTSYRAPSIDPEVKAQKHEEITNKTYSAFMNVFIKLISDNYTHTDAVEYIKSNVDHLSNMSELMRYKHYLNLDNIAMITNVASQTTKDNVTYDDSINIINALIEKSLKLSGINPSSAPQINEHYQQIIQEISGLVQRGYCYSHLVKMNRVMNESQLSINEAANDESVMIIPTVSVSSSASSEETKTPNTNMSSSTIELDNPEEPQEVLSPTSGFVITSPITEEHVNLIGGTTEV